MNIIVINFKKYVLTIFSIFLIICLLIFAENNILACKTGLNIFIQKVFPTLFPFLIATDILYNSNFIHILEKYTNSFITKLFNVPPKAAIAILLGLISGYPIGAKITANLKKDKYITKAEAERLIAFTNNSSPMFIISTVGISILSNKNLGIILLIIHIISSILVGLIFRFWKYNDKEQLNYDFILLSENNKLKENLSSAEIITNSIKNSIYTILQIGSFVIFFSILLDILKSTKILNVFAYILSIIGLDETFSLSFLYGFFEITNGLSLIQNIYLNNEILSIMIISFLLGFSGISILFQIYSIIKKEHISIKPYILGKLLQGIFSVILVCIFL